MGGRPSAEGRGRAKLAPCEASTLYDEGLYRDGVACGSMSLHTRSRVEMESATANGAHPPNALPCGLLHTNSP